MPTDDLINYDTLFVGVGRFLKTTGAVTLVLFIHLLSSPCSVGDQFVDYKRRLSIKTIDPEIVDNSKHRGFQ